MINSNELRIGNWVLFSNDSTKFIVGEISTTGLVVQNDQETTWIEIEEFEPIPLTEEILLKCGFKRVSFLNTTVSIKMEYENELLQMEWCDMWFGVSNDNYGSELMVNIQYLHQLQNLYFALTGEELKIEL